jgi:hypothetical protein
MISASILYSQNLEVPFERVKWISENIYRKMRENGAKSYVSNIPQPFDINQTAKSLGFEIMGHFESKNAKINVRDIKSQKQNLFSLALYANQIVYWFQFESFLSHALYYLEIESNM